ncbi:MAG: hypothetical protein SGARI_002741 [Bacillariaceae sp.]
MGKGLHQKQWMETYHQLEAYMEGTGGIEPTSTDHPTLARWISKQRFTYKTKTSHAGSSAANANLLSASQWARIELFGRLGIAIWLSKPPKRGGMDPGTFQASAFEMLGARGIDTRHTHMRSKNANGNLHKRGGPFRVGDVMGTVSSRSPSGIAWTLQVAEEHEGEDPRDDAFSFRRPLSLHLAIVQITFDSCSDAETVPQPKHLDDGLVKEFEVGAVRKV